MGRHHSILQHYFWIVFRRYNNFKNFKSFVLKKKTCPLNQWALGVGLTLVDPSNCPVNARFSICCLVRQSKFRSLSLSLSLYLWITLFLYHSRFFFIFLSLFFSSFSLSVPFSRHSFSMHSFQIKRSIKELYLVLVGPLRSQKQAAAAAHSRETPLSAVTTLVFTALMIQQQKANT